MLCSYAPALVVITVSAAILTFGLVDQVFTVNINILLKGNCLFLFNLLLMYISF